MKSTFSSQPNTHAKQKFTQHCLLFYMQRTPLPAVLFSMLVNTDHMHGVAQDSCFKKHDLVPILFCKIPLLVHPKFLQKLPFSWLTPVEPRVPNVQAPSPTDCLALRVITTETFSFQEQSPNLWIQCTSTICRMCDITEEGAGMRLSQGQ